MKLILYDDSNKVIDLVENVIDPVIEHEINVNWSEGSVRGIQVPFILVEDSVELGEVLTPEIIDMDKKNQFKV